MRKSGFIAIAAAATALAAAGAALAHHAVNASFVADKFVTMKGALVKVEMINPHSQFQFRVVGPDGKQSVWEIESSNVNGMRRAGLTQRNVLVAGDQFSMIINPSRDGSNKGFLRELTFPNGRKVNLAAGTLEMGE